MTQPPRDFGPNGPPNVYFTDPDVLSVDPSFDGLRQPNAPIQRLWTGALWSETIAGGKGDMYDFDVGADNRHGGASRAAASGSVNQAPFVNASQSSLNLSRDRWVVNAPQRT